jgi:hypothetical protein
VRTVRLSLLPLLLALPIAADASVFTSRSAFLAATSGADIRNVDFETPVPGSTLASGASTDVVTWTYSLSGAQLALTDGTSFGAAPSPASATSGSAFLGTDDLDHLQDGDVLGLGFSAPAQGIGLYVLSRDPLQDGDVVLTAGGESAALVAAAVEQTLPDGSNVWFLGVVDPGATLTGASIGYALDGTTDFLWNADDVVVAVPEPGAAVGLVAGTGLLAALARRRRADFAKDRRSAR